MARGHLRPLQNKSSLPAPSTLSEAETTWEAAARLAGARSSASQPASHRARRQGACPFAWLQACLARALPQDAVTRPWD